MECFVYRDASQFLVRVASGTELHSVRMPTDMAFGITGFNPAHPAFPANPSVAQNLQANINLLSALSSALNAYPPVQVFPSFGFSLDGWREDGFTVGCPKELGPEVRGIILELAVSFGQGAIYQYTRLADNMLKRDTIASSVDFKATEASVTMTGMDPSAYFPHLSESQQRLFSTDYFRDQT